MQRCPRCGNEIDRSALFCPRCGKRLPSSEAQAPTAEVVEQPAEAAEQPAADARRDTEYMPSEQAAAAAHDTAAPLATGNTSVKPSYRLTLLACLVAVLVFGALAGLVIGAIQSGQRERQKLYAAEALAYFQDGMKRIDSGEYSAAIALFETALKLDPSLTQAQDGINRAQALLENQVTPTIVPSVTPVPSTDELAAISSAYTAEDWDQVILLGTRFMTNYPGETTQELRDMLYEAFINKASLAVDEDQMGDAVRYLDQALLLKPDDETAAYMRQMAVLYQEGSAQFGADWESAISTFEQLVALDSNYKDVYLKLYNAHLGYADEAAEAGSWCLAAEQYALANDMIADDTVSAKQAEAETACQSQPTELPPAAPGIFVGSLIRTDSAESNKIYIGGYVLSADNKGVKGVRVKISAYDWSAVATTDSTGHYSFDGLTTAATYTLELLDVAAQPIGVPCSLGQFYQVNFVQTPEAETPTAASTPTPG